MENEIPPKQQKLPRFILKTSGIIMVAVGLVAAYYGPLEVYVFYMFSPGGRFAFEGFAVGSLWFAYLVLQNLGYYLVAALLLTLGIGTFTLRRWAYTLTRVVLWLWLGAGLLVSLNWVALVLYQLSANPSDPATFPRTAIFTTLLGFSTLVIPGMLLWFYSWDAVRTTFEGSDPREYWTERYPFPLLIVLGIMLAGLLAFHLALFLQGLFPFFGEMIWGQTGVRWLAGNIVIQLVILYGLIRLKRWALWSSIIYYSLLCFSAGLSFYGRSLAEVLKEMTLPQFEMEFLDRLKFMNGISMSFLIVPVLLVLLGLLIYSRKYFYPAKEKDLS